MNSERSRGGKSDTQSNGGSVSSSGARAVVRTGESAGDSLAMGAADTAVASSGAAAAAIAATMDSSELDAHGPTEHSLSSDHGLDAPERSLASSPGGGDDTADDGEDLLVGAVLLERYHLTRKIGQGGMGAVYEAKHIHIGKRVAVKVLLDKYAHRDQVVERLKQEARLASAIGHEHIIDINDVGETYDGRTFVVMEFLEGESLGACIQRDGALPEQRAIRIAHQIAGALHAAHEKNIVHRDIKPENVFLLHRKGQDFVKVVDFGISKSLHPEEGEHSPRLTQTGMVLGTPLYMSPEQARGSDHLDRRIDVYSLGVIMYEMITGEVPFHGNNYLSIISQVLNDEPRPPSELRPDISRELEDVILRALDKDPEGRYQSCDELAGDLALLIEDPGRTTTRGRVTATKYRRKRERRTNLVMLGWIAGIAVTVSAVVVTVVVLMSGAGKVEPPPEPAPVIITVPVDAAPPVEQPDAAPAVKMVRIKFVSQPEGAVVYQGGRVIGTTPFEYEFIHENRKISLIAELEGHNDTEFEVNPYRDDFGRTGKAVRFILKKPRRGAKIKKIDKNKQAGDPAKDPQKDPTKDPNGDTDVPEGLDPNPLKQLLEKKGGGQ